MHTNVYVVYACGCSLSVTCQVAVVNTISADKSTRELGSSSSEGGGGEDKNNPNTKMISQITM